MKVLESFLIALGLKVDKKSFEAGEAAFDGITKSALQLGAVLASKLAIDKVVGDFKNVGTELDNFNKLTGLSTQNVQTLGQAIKAQGGNASDAFAAMKKMQDLMASPITGDTGWFGDVAKLGLNPDVIIRANDTADALANIAGEFEKMTPLNQRLAGQALGLDDSTVRLLMRGREEVEKQLDSRSKLGVMTGRQIEDSARLTKATSELDLVFTDMGNTIAGELAPAFADMAEDFVAFYRDNKDLIDSGLKEFFGELADNIELVAIAMALMGGSAALKGLAALRAVVGLGGAAAAGKAAAGNLAVGGASMLAVAGGSAAALLYSSKLNEGEDTELLNNRLKRGGGEAVGATVDYFMQKGWTREQAEGIAANLEQESGFKADAEGDGGNAYGLAQWHKDRQDNFAKRYGKDIRKSTGAEQLEFINHELTRGNERSAGDKLRTATNSSEAASIVSREYERPADKEGEASRRGDRAAAYGQAQPKPDQVYGAEVAAARKPEQQQAYDDPGEWKKVQREAPREHTVNAVVQPTPQASITPSAQAAPPAQPSYADNRQFHIHGADTEKVKQLYTEQLSSLTEQTMQDFRSPEK
ncbi:phage tail tip lysozyme [Pseudomonas sp. GL-B-16]|uniref:phage tail tip lysozyme n=1 Tax=Pseudomonas sp. GL-B-16 TaxID=2832373 RepID=UPI001CBD44D2|nr:phage tail tip lysozyme [Pseudomonas sp. GL-B-16]